jgi:hypothetical protein
MERRIRITALLYHANKISRMHHESIYYIFNLISTKIYKILLQQLSRSVTASPKELHSVYSAFYLYFFFMNYAFTATNFFSPVSKCKWGQQIKLHVSTNTISHTHVKNNLLNNLANKEQKSKNHPIVLQFRSFKFLISSIANQFPKDLHGYIHPWNKYFLNPNCCQNLYFKKPHFDSTSKQWKNKT